MIKNRVRKAIIPVPGLGTRFLPVTKSQAKEMPKMVQYIFKMVNIY